MSSAILWLALEAWWTLDQTFNLPYGLRWLLEQLDHRHTFWRLVIQSLINVWPGAILVFTVVLRRKRIVGSTCGVAESAPIG